LLRQRAGAAGFDDVEQYVLQRALCSAEDLAAMDAAATDPRAVGLRLEGLQSGPLTPMTTDDWNNLRDLVRQRLKGN
jgi:hypothetical protein